MHSKHEKIFIANDHTGFQLKNLLINHNSDQNWEDLGIFNEKTSHYPEQAELLCRRILENTAHKLNNKASLLGVLICGSGQGMAIKANRFQGIRAALAWNEESCRLAREHNNVNVLCLGARLLSFEDSNDIFKKFINTPFKGGRHLKRVESLDRNEH